MTSKIQPLQIKTITQKISPILPKVPDDLLVHVNHSFIAPAPIGNYDIGYRELYWLLDIVDNPVLCMTGAARAGNLHITRNMLSRIEAKEGKIYREMQGALRKRIDVWLYISLEHACLGDPYKENSQARLELVKFIVEMLEYKVEERLNLTKALGIACTAPKVASLWRAPKVASLWRASQGVACNPASLPKTEHEADGNLEIVKFLVSHTLLIYIYGDIPAWFENSNLDIQKYLLSLVPNHHRFRFMARNI